MKKRLNLFCVLMLLVLAAEIVLSFVFSWDTFTDGWRDAAKGTDIHMKDYISGVRWLFFISAPFVIYFGIRAFVSFVRFILNVNRNQVFVWDNVRLLRWTGWGILIWVALCVIIELFAHVPLATICSEYMDMLVIGVFSLIVSEVFAIGLKLKEEQDLTI